MKPQRKYLCFRTVSNKYWEAYTGLKLVNSKTNTGAAAEATKRDMYPYRKGNK